MSSKDKLKNGFNEAKEFFILEKGYLLKSQTEDNIIFESQKREWGGGALILLLLGILLFLFVFILGILLIILAVILHLGKGQPTITGTKIGKKIAWQGNSQNTNRDINEFLL